MARLDFLGGYLPSLNVNYVGVSRDMETAVFYATAVLYKDETFLRSGFSCNRSRHSNEMTPLHFSFILVFLCTRIFLKKSLKGVRTWLNCFNYGKVWTNSMNLLGTRRCNLCLHLPLSTDYPAVLTFATSSNCYIVLELEETHQAFLYDFHTCGNKSENISVPEWVDSIAVQSVSPWRDVMPQCKCRIHSLCGHEMQRNVDDTLLR